MVLSKAYDDLDIQYLYTGHDKSTSHYIAKLWFALNNIDSKYCVFVDNDDFLSLRGFHQGVLFLENNISFQEYRADVRDLHISNNSLSLGQSLYTAQSILNEDPINRLNQSIQTSNSNWHNLQRTHGIRAYLNIMHF